MLGGSLVLWAVFYLVFTIHGIALRDVRVFQSMRISVTLMRAQFLPTMGLILLCRGRSTSAWALCGIFRRAIRG